MEPEKGSKQNTAGKRAWDSISVHAFPCQLCPRERGITSTPSRFPQAQRPRVSPIVGVRVCGIQVPTVPESQPYLARRIHRSLSGRLARPRRSVLKLSVRVGESPRTQEVPQSSQHCACGSNQHAVACTPVVSRHSDAGVGVAVNADSSPTVACDDTCLELTLTSHSDNRVTWAPMHYSKLCAVKCNAERNLLPPTPPSPVGPLLLAPLNSSRRLSSGWAWHLCISSVSTALPQANFEVRRYCRVAAPPSTSSAFVRRTLQATPCTETLQQCVALKRGTDHSK